MKKLALTALVPVLMLFGATQVAHAQELKIGYVNSDKVMRESAPAKAATSRLESEFTRRDKELNDLGARLKASSERIEKDAPTLAEAERARRQRELVEQDREFQRRRRELQEDFNQRRNEELAAVIERANRVIKQIAEAEKYDLIVQEAVHWSPRVDITDKVIKALNANGGK
jgi:outer membrane protein